MLTAELFNLQPILFVRRIVLLGFELLGTSLLFGCFPHLPVVLSYGKALELQVPAVQGLFRI